MSTACEPDLNPASLTSNLHWQDGFASLGPDFYTRQLPQPLGQPYWVGRSQAVGDLIGLDAFAPEADALLDALSGNSLLPGSQPMASVYSGHQFGVWAGQLGDGRAILLGETSSGWEIQLKGSGLTPYSRMGDGRAVLRSSIREFLCSEAMHALGIPSTRAFCVTGSEDRVRRESIETAAVVTRVAPSFIRFGHFEHFASTGQLTQLRQLADFVIERYYPGCLETSQPYVTLLEQVAQRTARLMAKWQAAGFCHGVMNTDNMSILGLTLDYGPFQFLDGYDPDHICNHSDPHGRYAYKRQPGVAYWNLHCLARALLPLIEDQDLALAALAPFQQVFSEELLATYRAKLGFACEQAKDPDLIDQLLQLLAREHTDYPIFWRSLSHFAADGKAAPLSALFVDHNAINSWLVQYEHRLSVEDSSLVSQSMLKTNPKFVLRNHLGEMAIRQARDHDYSGVQTLLGLLENPFDEHPEHDSLAGLPPDWAASIAISCSS
jgi:uncharacterized protein YdiU (UPF0061 family)